MDSGRCYAPVAREPVRARLRLPGSTLITNRAPVWFQPVVAVLNVATPGKMFPDVTTRREELVRGDDS
jgi:hypothetical protein